ncbi:hypothetical protein H5410_008016 [Solanum commersonii]|uniref:Uncharacterized protein n=1 Tax=Solanum commersonii TaxID=4109 RepID=A0A9J6ADP8_SOLCO|nr:hypothetical protein H5410_008016 [Solanum commersonii]
MCNDGGHCVDKLTNSKLQTRDCYDCLTAIYSSLPGCANVMQRGKLLYNAYRIVGMNLTHSSMNHY